MSTTLVLDAEGSEDATAEEAGRNLLKLLVKIGMI